VYINIKADKAAITKRRIYPPHLSLGFSNGQVGQLLRKSRGMLTVCRFRCFGALPQGWREAIARVRIQTAAEGVNGFALHVCESRNLLDTNAYFCIGCRRSSRFNEERP
jgi:hypothetical protein